MLLDHPNSLYIDGKWEEAGERDVVLNPATEEAIGEAPVAGRGHGEAAIAAAREAFDSGIWPRMSQQERQLKLLDFLEAIRRRQRSIIPLIVAETGSLLSLAESIQFGVPLQLARQQVESMYERMTTPLPLDVRPNPDGTRSLAGAIVAHQPIGVVAAITPYNVPFLSNVCKVTPALLMGCTVVLKPSPYTPFEALILGEIADEVGLPKGVLNILNGGADVGAALTSDPRVDMITFTGSDKVGQAIQTEAAPMFKRVVLELGGKSALIVRHDADVARAVEAGLGGITMHCGQGCVLLTRHIVHNSVREKYIDALAARLKAIRIGNPSDPASMMGPLIREAARSRVEGYVSIAAAEGARLVTGGRRPQNLDRGYFFEPTLFADVENSMRLAQEEVFGPIGAVIGFDDDDEAIAMANDSRYGLSGAIYSADAGRAYEMALAMRTGGVTINTPFTQLTPNAPFGGVKASGQGREYGPLGLAEFTYAKTIDYQVA